MAAMTFSVLGLNEAELPLLCAHEDAPSGAGMALVGAWEALMRRLGVKASILPASIGSPPKPGEKPTDPRTWAKLGWSRMMASAWRRCTRASRSRSSARRSS